MNQLGHKTDLLLNKLEGAAISEYENYLVVKTETRPDYFWGNFIIFKDKPNNDYENWTKIYRQHFGNNYFFALTWDSQEIGNIEDFLENDFSLTTCKVLSTNQLISPQYQRADLIIRPLEKETDWQQFVEVHQSDDWKMSKESEISFLEGIKTSHQKMVNDGYGLRFGAFEGEKLIGELGIYHDGNYGRFNQVSTHQNYRKQGVCQNLVYQASIFALEKWHLKSLVIVADDDYHAGRIYEKLGFKVTEKQLSLEWHDKEKF